MKFVKSKIIDLMTNLPVVHFESDDFMVIASSEGIKIRGESPIFNSHAEMEDFAKIIGQAFKESLKLRIALRSTLTSQ